MRKKRKARESVDIALDRRVAKNMCASKYIKNQILRKQMENI